MTGRVAIAMLLALPACGFSVAGDASGDCYRLESILGELGERCGGHELAPGVLRCDDIIASSLTSGDVDACAAWARDVSCESLRAPGSRPPDSCQFNAVRTP